ncbi:MAG TPA: hypothetical protein DEQ87_13685 [Algoriphagus sp.]|jgi:hypothetical protein|uniref:DUF6161 domain-containing protein n=3 Tax=Algoriphagus TaxID=246875 RepID=UPI000C50A607|nr:MULTISPECIES: DUF6161 domain-containing protein [unclassified Algoriphagus]MAL15099.1 hypothetical protein [Algoriphagus sp.]HAH36815.1 hypothetical protein [Algoriphagus sp.]HAS57304.1 hypothetical protein [Algoriphagus sp.]HCB46994.1 hypothetical protein [Algoriphagus sp.]HCD88671.1 hypothetical protein [Algoriphagus sp.]|tara:strand:- start:3119 stop:4384 length:1266 start_codon:yes stop_codon:yes gene_type:complete
MNLKEIKKEISEATKKDFFVNLEIQVSVPKTGINRKLTGVSAFYDYLENQIKGFQSLEGDLPNEFKDSLKLFEDLKKRVVSFINSYKSSTNEPGFKSGWTDQVGRFFSNSQIIFEFDAPNTDFLLEIFRSKKQYYSGAVNYLTGNISPGGIQDRNYLNGVILAYEYFQKGETEIKKRRDNEKSSLSRFRNHIDEYISKSEGDFISHSGDLKKKTDDTIDEIIKYKESKTKEYEDWFGKTSKSFSEFDASSHEKITYLENLYHEKLKLEAPAQYWNKRAKSLKTEGRWWLVGLILSIIAGVGIFIYALQLLSDGTLKDIFDDTATAVKWSVIFITLVSFLAFLIKTLSKMTFSTFHLSRDAEEREQLTYVFLAMQKEKAIDPTERHLIMQSLFSRADTGLLKDEGSPTMPGNIFDKVIASGK